MMSSALFKPLDVCSKDWESPTGPLEASASPRCERHGFIYVGYGDPHWRGQPCDLVGVTNAFERQVTLACGCRITVPWWTLDPIASAESDRA